MYFSKLINWQIKHHLNTDVFEILFQGVNPVLNQVNIVTHFPMMSSNLLLKSFIAGFSIEHCNLYIGLHP